MKINKSVLNNLLKKTSILKIWKWNYYTRDWEMDLRLMISTVDAITKEKQLPLFKWEKKYLEATLTLIGFQAKIKKVLD